MICINCKKQIDDDSKFCVFCGFQQIDELNYNKGNLEPFKKNNRWGYKDINSKDIVIPPKYTFAGAIIENRAVVGLGEKYAIIDENGNELTQFKYDSVSDFVNGYAKVKRDNKWSLIDSNCNLIAPFKYTEVNFFKDGLAKFKLESNYI